MNTLILAMCLWGSTAGAQATAACDLCSMDEPSGNLSVLPGGEFIAGGLASSRDVRLRRETDKSSSVCTSDIPRDPKTCEPLDAAITISSFAVTAFQEDKIEVEPLTDAEWKELSEAHERLETIKGKIRFAHGEDKRGWCQNFVLGICVQTSECRGSETTVQIRGKQVLKTTRYANGGCF